MNRLTKLTLIDKILCGASLAICLYFLASFLFLILSNFWPGPLFDYWVDIPLVENYFNNQLTFNELVSAHNNAHRILIPRLLFILDYCFFSGTNILLIAVSILCKMATLLLFNRLLGQQNLATRLLLNALIFAAVLNAGNVYNILFNFDIQWDLVSIFACYSIFFYSKTFETKKNILYRMLAYALMCLGFFSHAGALSIPFAFIVISAFKKNKKEIILNIILMLGVFYTHSLLPFANPDNPDVQGALTTLILHASAVSVFVTKFVSGSLAFYLGKSGLYFSAYMLVLFVICIVLTNKTRLTCDNIFLHFSIFLFLMIVSIAASRSTFNPRIWAASRFQTTALLFILSVHIHAWLILDSFLKNKLKHIAQSFIAAHGFIIFFLLQYFTYNIPYKLSNAVFYSQAYMLAHERNQNDGSRLLLWLHEDNDVIAGNDGFFRKNGFAWYANKQTITGSSTDFTDTGKTLITPDRISTFESTCAEKINVLNYQWTQDEGISFTALLPHIFLNPELLHRNTYYALDNNGVSVGSAYISVNEEGMLKQASLAGYSVAQTVRFIADVDNHHQPRCLYSVTGEH